MSNRKLAQEVERTVKKVNEGVELFDEILDKVYNAPNASQRDKFEGELKKEIKKLQRLREQIRAWIGGNEVKDKAELLEKRKVIEARMEKFKICEQKTKMKAYSKEALSQKQIQSRKKSKVIPETEEKKEAKNWIRECQDAIQQQIEELEGELEEHQKARKPDVDVIETFKRRIKSHQKYLEKLDTAYMYLEEDQVKFEDIEEIKESVEYYVDENSEPDFVEDELVFDNLFKKAEEAELYDDFEDIEDEVIMEGNVIQALPANAEPVASLKTDEADVLKLVDDNAAKLKEKQEKERLEKEKLDRIEREKLEEIERQRLELERIEQEKKAAAAKSAAALAKKQAITTVPPVATTTTTVQPTTAATKTVTSPKAATKQTTKQQKAAAKATKVQPPAPAPVKKVVTPELNFVAAAAASQSPTKTVKPQTTILPKQTTKPAQLNVKSNVSYIDAINAGAPTLPITPITITPVTITPNSTSAGSKGTTPRTGASTPPIEPMHILKNDMADITIQTIPTTPVKPIIMNKEKKAPQPTAQSGAGFIGQNVTDDQSNEETFGSMAIDMGSLEHMASRTQEMNQNFQMGMPQNIQPQHPMTSVLGAVSGGVGVPHMESGMGAMQMGGMMGMANSVAANMAAGFAQSPSPTMQSIPSTPSILKPDSYDYKSEMLQASLNNLPHPGDCERPRQYSPVNPFDTPSFFPQEQLPLFKDSAVYTMMDPDTLFFIFYFQQGTYQQYLAAKALKKHAWRYHKKYQTWFQRHDPPTHTTNEFELGTYVYFDYEQDWCQRIKSGFRFEYEYLEDAVL